MLRCEMLYRGGTGVNVGWWGNWCYCRMSMVGAQKKSARNLEYLGGFIYHREKGEHSTLLERTISYSSCEYVDDGMATAGMGNSSSLFLLNQIRRIINGCSVLLIMSPYWLVPGTVKRFLAERVKASTSAALAEPILDEKKLENLGNVLACPICYEPLVSNDDSGISSNPVTGPNLQCKTCRKAYFGNETHIDLTIATGDKEKPTSTELFRLPLVSFLYERGWRQSFSVLGGFPGPEKEFELIKDYLSPVLGGNIVDASCGSGLLSRPFAKSGLFSLVVALDFSEAMLQQCYEFIKQEKDFPKENIILVRADIYRLPFASGSIDAVHAGAALHCWPSPSAAVAEISRVLRPGGMFVATTFILDGPIAFLGTFRQNFARISGSYLFLSNRELQDLFTACGLVDFEFTRSRRFVMISARKPN